MKMQKQNQTNQLQKKERIQKIPITSQQQKQTLKRKISNSYSLIIRNKQIFKAITFMLPLYNIHLTKKRCDILSKVIKKNGGKIIEIGIPDLIIVNQTMSHSEVLQALYNHQLQQCYLKYCVKDQFIHKCLKDGSLLDFSDFLFQAKFERIDQQEQFTEKEQFSKKRKLDQLFFQTNRIKRSQNIYEEDQELNKTKKIRKSKSELILQQQQLFSSYQQEKANKDEELIQLKNQYWNKKKEFFLCQKKQLTSFNQLILKNLIELQNIYSNTQDKGRTIAYQKAISIIRSLKKDIKSEQDVHELKGIGPKTKNKIIEIIQTGRLQKKQNLENLNEIKAYKELGRVWGIGPSTARILFRKNINTIEELKKNTHLLSKHQMIGLKYLEQFQSRIPRQEVKEMQEYIKKQLKNFDRQNMYEMVIAGSYRRGKQTCGDVDIIFTKKDGKFQKQFLIQLIKILHDKNFLTDDLSIPNSQKPHQSLSYMGVCMFKKIHRRIDLKHYPLQSFPFALLYFTGSQMFNRSMRLFAKKKGYSLSDHGITRVQRVNNKKVWNGQKIQCFSEEQIFNFFQLQYKEPCDRNM